MMKSKSILTGMIVAGVALSSTSVLADTQGTQTFTANIAESTCVITGLNESLVFPAFSVADIYAAGDDSDTIIGEHIGSHSINVVGCPTGTSSMNITATYNVNPRYTNKPVIALTGTGKGIGMWIYKSTASGGDNYWLSGKTISQPIVNGQASQIVGVIPYGDFAGGKADIVAGSYEGIINFAIDFT